MAIIILKGGSSNLTGSLAAAISSTATTITVQLQNSVTGEVAQLDSDTNYMVIDRNNSNEERFYFDRATATVTYNPTTNITTITPVVRGLPFQGEFTGTGDASRAKSHASNAPVGVDDYHGAFLMTSLAVNGDEPFPNTVDFAKKVTFSGTDTAGLQLKSLTTAQMNAIASPANGDQIYNSTDGQVYAYIGGSWVAQTSGGTFPNASTTVAGKVELATQAENNAGTATGGTGASLVATPDVNAVTIQNGRWTYGTAGGTGDAITLTVTPAITAYAAGQSFSFTAGAANTTAVTLNVNGLGVKNVLLNGTTSLLAGQISSGQIVQVQYDGTQFQLITTKPSTTKGNFGGDGSDGVLNVASGTTTIDLGGAQVFVRNYTTINIAAGATVNFSNPASTGTIVIFKSTGNRTIAGTIDLQGIGGIGGTGGATGNPGANGNAGTNGLLIVDDAAHGGLLATGGASQTANGGAIMTGNGIYSRSAAALSRKNIAVFCGSGGGGAAGPSSGTVDPVRFAAGANGGRGGGGFYSECAGTSVFTGSVNTSGSAGSTGTTISNTTYAVGGGGGGGGSAGIAVLLANTLSTNTGTFTATGGAGGAGGDATVTSGASATTVATGAAGAGAGSIGSAGANGATSSTSASTDISGTVGNNASGAGAGGGGGTGARRTASNGTSTGGAGGMGGTSLGGISVQNFWFA